jgi:hypothetical protein
VIGSWGGLGVRFIAPWFLDLRGGSGSAAGHPFADRVVSMVRSGHDQTGSSRSSTSPPGAGVMPITGSRRAVSEPSHAAAWAWARQRIWPSRRP